MLETLSIERPETLKDLVYKKVRGLLTAGQLSPETIYSANHLADGLGVSRTPVREALLQLTAEGLFVSLGGRGFKVRALSAKEIQDFFELRLLIEAHVVGHFGKRALKPVEEAMQRMAALERRGDEAGFLQADERFHMRLIQEYGNHRFLSAMEQIRGCISLLGQKALLAQGRMRDVGAEHLAIVAALRKGDARLAVEAMRRHLRTTEQYLLQASQEDATAHARNQHPA